jgi:uncharacterized pyridoxamine 5'-phosphate oxidase family protein
MDGRGAPPPAVLFFVKPLPKQKIITILQLVIDTQKPQSRRSGGFTMEEVLQYLNDAGVYYIATVDKEGKPHLRPFGSRVIFEGKFYIFMNFPKPVYTQVMENRYVEIATMGKDQSWIRIAAKAVPEERLEMREKILKAAGAPPRIKAETEMVFELTEATATIYKGEDKRIIAW